MGQKTCLTIIVHKRILKTHTPDEFYGKADYLTCTSRILKIHMTIRRLSTQTDGIKTFRIREAHCAEMEKGGQKPKGPHTTHTR